LFSLAAKIVRLSPKLQPVIQIAEPQSLRHRRMAAICAYRTAGVDGYCSLLGQGRKLLPDFDAFGCLRSLRARSALNEVSWVQGG
jgi:hypothetical protein